MSNTLNDDSELHEVIYYRPHKHRNWKYENYEVIVGDLIVNIVETKNSAEVLVSALRGFVHQRDEARDNQDIVPCGYCMKAVLRNPQYCNHSCRQQAYMQRKKQSINKLTNPEKGNSNG